MHHLGPASILAASHTRQLPQAGASGPESLSQTATIMNQKAL
jgi:hypothetical protein